MSDIWMWKHPMQTEATDPAAEVKLANLIAELRNLQSMIEDGTAAGHELGSILDCYESK